jgi:pimeloyl-ACP methyl ester carboxylesterase
MSPWPDRPVDEHPISIPVGPEVLEGSISAPAGAQGIVVFAHGSGSSRQSPRNRYVAGVLRAQGIATLLADLLTTKEEAIDAQTGSLRFDITFLAGRLAAITDALMQRPEVQDFAVGYFGASTGAAAALVVGGNRPDAVRAIVSRGGRPDLAGPALSRVRAPTLLIVGGDDIPVIRLNRDAMRYLRCENELAIVPGATHLFEEPGTLEEVARLAAGWFARHLGR